jgi:hypothetical protein
VVHPAIATAMSVTAAATERDDFEIERRREAMSITKAKVRDIEKIRCSIGTVRQCSAMPYRDGFPPMPAQPLPVS